MQAPRMSIEPVFMFSKLIYPDKLFSELHKKICIKLYIQFHINLNKNNHNNKNINNDYN